MLAGDGLLSGPGLAHYLGGRLKTGRGFMAFDAGDAAPRRRSVECAASVAS